MCNRPETVKLGSKLARFQLPSCSIFRSGMDTQQAPERLARMTRKTLRRLEDKEGKPMIDLLKFCSKGETRINISRPFSKGEYTYATNGHLAIRVARTDQPENLNAPDCERLFATAIERGDPPWIDLPPFQLIRKRCQDCNGTGFVDEFECEECYDGILFSGSAIVKAEKGDVKLASIYLDLLKELPEIKIGVVGDESSRTDKPIRFKFDGGEGLLMPMKI